ncbi:MAG: hypothetical protein KJ995_00530 [Candidatus Omnitrophica bacterium]|nr:hypothetical protein [Candidatus Omnitrophota bacterium]MBU1128018.1 hypothetical protein [Candidatus Omnitrophota bacterium]MBU1657418.1 hypothetical protein [Candidatus Omnitrophota bacterium]MBU1784806.1 hypothetical protein [Candidatus Omnitrophota bacterium]MBU1850879.1 hypothetical protein [Candidatus Omnitrophota bacterium]
MFNVKRADRRAMIKMIEKLTEDDLVFLNRTIVERLKLISQAKSTMMMSKFTIGDRVKFQTPNGENKTGFILRLNKKTASIETDDNLHWKVYPGFLAHA